ncbi:MAG: DUF222 domain-containing protein [Ilumatobacteraceae bacterium]|nr:DUF222 domain-containing protein [Ilumatobacteraceae bacterium]
MKDPVLSQALAALDGADIAASDDAGCAALLASITKVQGWLSSTEARVTSRMRELHATSGCMPASDRHTIEGGVSSAEGKRKERRSEAIDDVPSFGEALADGQIGAEHVDALANASAKLDDEVKARLFEDEDELLAEAASMSPERFGRSVRERARRLERDQGLERNRRQRRDTYLSRKLNGATGMIEGRFAFHPELANQIFGAVDLEVAAMVAEGEQRADPEFADRRVDRNRLAAEALGRLVGGGHQQIRPAEADITAIVDVTTAETGELHDHSVCETDDGAALPPASVLRLLCNGRVTPIYVDADGNPLAVGHTTRHANRAQRQALRALYRTCGFGECDTPFARCEIHHVLPWQLGGPTDLANLIPVCSRHHHVIHDHGLILDLLPDRTLTVARPDGTAVFTSEPDVPSRRSTRSRRRRTAA